MLTVQAFRNFCVAAVFSTFVAMSAGSAVGQQRSAEPAPQSLNHAESLSSAFRSAAHEILPTVVQLRTKTNAKLRRRNLDELFGSITPQQEGIGSGVIIRGEGLIMTNNHVVDGVDEVVVELPDGREFTAVDIRTDPETDLAILRIEDAGPLPAARLGNSDEMQIGDWVLAVGNPFNLEATVSAGIVSAKGRSLVGSSASRASYIQTDAAINPGNSGGPLVNLAGEVIGINTAIHSSSGGYQGIGFALPVNLAKWVSGQLVANGKVQRAYLGVQISELNQRIATAFEVDARTKGVFVSQLIEDSPAAHAGVELGDIITTFAGKPIKNGTDLQRTVETLPLGSEQTLSVIRGGKPQQLRVRLEALTAKTRSARPIPESEIAAESELGLAVSDLNSELARQLGLPDSTTGALVVQVSPQGAAKRSGLQKGMVIIQVGNRTIRSAEELEIALDNADLTQGALVTVRIPAIGDRLLILKN